MAQRKYAVGIIANSQTPEEIKFNLDALTFLNMLDGMSYEQAVKQSHKDIKEVNDDLAT